MKISHEEDTRGRREKQVPARQPARHVAWSSPSVQRKQAVANFAYQPAGWTCLLIRKICPL